MKVRQGITMWYGRIEDAERYPDISYWQSQSDEKRFEAAWQMVIDAHAIQGEDLSESRLQRTVASLHAR